MKRRISKIKRLGAQNGPKNLKRHGFTNGLWRLQEMAAARSARLTLAKAITSALHSEGKK